MPNRIDPNELICANCSETRPGKFGKTRSDVEIELTPVDGLQAVYLCKDCQDWMGDSAVKQEQMRLSSVFQLTTRQMLTGPQDQSLYMHRLNLAKKQYGTS